MCAMSGKPATPAASRAGVAGVPGAPRVLVYVADPRQLDPGAAATDPPPELPGPSFDALYLHDNVQHVTLPNALYRTQEQNDQTNLPNTLYYKNENYGKLGPFGVTDNTTPQSADFFPISQHLLKESYLKVDEDKIDGKLNPVNVKNDSNLLGTEYNSNNVLVTEFCGRVPLETGEITTYQTQCSNLTVSDNNMPPAQPVILRHGQYNENNIVHSGGSEIKTDIERDISVDKTYMNYQFLEQSVSHQSVVNQSISILNRQVGVGRGGVSEVDSTTVPQLVRTAEGVVLAVLPSNVLAQPTDSVDVGTRTANCDSFQTVVVPLGWKRVISGTSVLYISPSGTALSNLPQLRDYLQTTGTCKCGLPCPLRPETTFSFDPKVVSKPYQPTSGAELTRLCNHKRKLLATLQARAQSPGTPPPHQHLEQKKVAAATGEVTLLKKKMKKRPGFPPNMSVSQLMVQRERPLSEFKTQDNEQNRTSSPGIIPLRPNGPTCMPNFPSLHQNISNSQGNEIKQETYVQKSSHFLTVSSGWISQQETLLDTGQKAAQVTTTPANNVGLPVLGTNGQIIGVNTGFNKQASSYRNFVGVSSHNIELETKDDKKPLSPQQNILPNKQHVKEEESQIFCGLNQPLTPEVMQKINEQQQLFIQQNQKQIELAMKGYRTQISDNHNKLQGQNQYATQGQLVIQNGTVVKTNPAKTPPWQVKRNDSNNTTTSPSMKSNKIDNTDYEESNVNISEESSGSNNSFANDNIPNQAMCSRVPPLPQHYNMMGQQWPGVDTHKKKIKNNNKGLKKKSIPNESKVMTFGNNGIRPLLDQKEKSSDGLTNNVPSFMDDPNGYLAQQTVLLNNTISRQVGINSTTYDTMNYESSSCDYTLQNEKSCKITVKNDGGNNYRSNTVQNPSPSPNNMPDSSVLPENVENKNSQCCKGCTVPFKGTNSEFSEQMRFKYMKQHSYKMELDNMATSSPNRFEDNPVISSTFIERNVAANENCSPIQAGTVSTSNVSPMDTLQPPEPSPTPSNSSRNTDTPHSSGSNNSQLLQNCTFPLPSPANSNSTYKDNFNSNPSTPGSNQSYHYNSPGPPIHNPISGTQMMHFISNHNVNKNLMEVDNISMVGVKPGMKTPHELFKLEPRKRVENSMPGYCPPPHLGGGPAYSLIQACYVQTFVTTMASGFSVTRDTVTSVLAGKANTSTTSINASQANYVRAPPPPSTNLATSYAIPNNQPDPFLNSVNLPTSYPLHIAGTTAQNMISKSPLEMIQNVIGGPLKSENNAQIASAPVGRRICQPATPGQILISSTGQIIVSNNQMPPPPPKTTTSITPMQTSNAVCTVTTSVTQVGPAVGGVQPLVNPPTVVVNTLPSPFVIQPPMMAVDGQVVPQNAVLPQIVAGGIVSQTPNENTRQLDMKTGQNYIPGVAMLSPESLKKRSKKKKNQTTNVTNVLHITAPQQSSNNIIMQHSSPQHNTSPQFSPRGFQLSPNSNVTPAPMLQALTIVPGKSGTPAHIVMNGQGNTNSFGSQQIITNTSPSQQINLLQPVNLINNPNNVMPNFQAFQQFIVPNLSGMVMTADGTAIIQDSSTGMPMQLQLQTVNGQNVLTPVQNPGVFTAGPNGGVVLRAQKSQHSPGAQFLSPNSQVIMNSPNFNGQLSPLLANLSPTNVTFSTSPHQVRSGSIQAQEFIQANQMGQTLMVPVSPKQVSLSTTANNRSNPTLVQQNTTIVQQQTTLVSNSHSAQMPSITANLQGGNRLSIDPNVLLTHKPMNQKVRNVVELPPENNAEAIKEERGQSFNQNENDDSEGYAKFIELGPLGQGGFNSHVRHSVSTQTLVNQQRGKSPCHQAVSGSSPPDTTTHSPLGALEPSRSGSPRVYSMRCVSTQGNYADTTTKSPEPADANSSAMVQCVSSSEQDMAESREHAWSTPRSDFQSDIETHNLPNVSMVRQNRTHSSIETIEAQYSHNLNLSTNNPPAVPMTSHYYERNQTYKRKNEFGDGSPYRTDKIIRTSYNMIHGIPKESEYESNSSEKNRIFQPSGTSADNTSFQKVFDRHNLGPGNDTKIEDDCKEKSHEPPVNEKPSRKFEVGDLVWGPVKGYASWPGKLQGRNENGRWNVQWFGSDKAQSSVEDSRLLTLSEGLEAHHAARTKHRKSRKLNTLLENAIQEAMADLDKKCDSKTEDQSEGSTCGENYDAPITETPRKSRKHDKGKSKNKHKKILVKSVSDQKSDGARLRSSR